jgi:hypothetical protein
MRGTLARNIARDAGFFVVPVEEYGVVRVANGALELGPEASPDAIATIALRKQLLHDDVHDELEVRALVESFGFAYVPQRHERRGDSGVAYRAVG